MKTVLRNSYTPKIGDYCETIVVDKETENAYIFDCDGVFTPMPQPVDVEDILRRAAEYTDETVAPINEKLDTIEEGAQVNKIEHVLRNGTELTITNKTVNVTVPTKTSDLTNDGSDGTDTYVETSTLDNYYTKTETDTQIGYETTAREIADAGLQEQIDAIAASSDVVDIVGTYAELQAYDTSKLHDNDIIKVLADETRDEATTYYRWDKDTSTWGYIGAEGPFYTKAESDATFVPQTRTVNNKALSANITLTASDVGALPDSTVIPTVNDAILTIQKNGTDVATFTANSATNEVADITVPTDTNDLTNGAGFVTAEDVYDSDCERGNPIELVTPVEAPLNDYSLYGNTVQNGTPTPDAPVPVQTVTGENVVKICGKNLFYIEPQTLNGVTLSYDSDGAIVLNGTSSSSFTAFKGVIPPTAGTLSSKTTAAKANVYVRMRNASGTLAHSIDLANIGEQVVRSNATVTQTEITIGASGVSFDNFKIYAQFESGQTATTYEPYQGQSYGVNLFGNLYDKSAAVKTGGSNQNISFSTEVDVNTSYVFDCGSRTWVTVYLYDSSDTLTRTLGNTSSSHKVEFTTSASEVKARLEFYAGASAVVATYDFSGVNFYKTNGVIELCKIGTYQDYIWKDGDTWKVHKAIGKAVLDGSGTWSFTTNGNAWYKANWANANGAAIPSNNDTVASVLCQYFSAVSRNNIANVSSGFGIASSAAINMKHPDYTSASSDFVGWLNSTKPTVYYALATPTDTAITNTALIEQLDAILANAKTYAGTTNISLVATAGNASGELQVCYTESLVPLASENEFGIVRVGDGIDVLNGTISVDLPAKTSDLTNDGSDGTSTYVEADDLATVATTGDYSDLLNTPTIPTVNNATLTIQKNGTAIDTFTANASVDKAINVTVPTDTSDLTNNAGFITNSVSNLTNYYTKTDTYTQQEVNSLINTITIPTKTSDLTNDGSDGASTYVEADELATVATTGDYDDLLNKPTIPTIVDMTGATASTAGAHGYVPAPAAGDEDKVLKGDGTWGTVAAPYSAGTGIDITNNVISADTTVLATQTDLSNKQDTLTAGNAIDITNNTISVEVDSALDVSSTNPVQNSVITAALPTDMTGASSTVAGAHGLVPAPAAGDDTKVLKGDGTWGEKSDKFVIMKYGESNAWAKFIDAYNNNKIVYCRASSNANPGSGAQTRLAFMAYVSAESNPTNVEFQYVRSVGTKTSSQPVDQVFVYKLTNANGGTWSVESRDMAPKLAAGTNASVSYSNGTYTVSATQPTVPTKTSDLTNDGSDGTSTYVEADELATVATSGDYDDLTNLPAIPNYTAGDHISISSNTISAVDYVHSENPVSVTTPGTTVSGSEITDGSITFNKTSAGEFLKLQLTTTDPGEGAALAANTLLGVYV